MANLVANRDWLIVTVYRLRHAKCDLRKFGFTNTVTNTWNSLPLCVANCVISANTTKTLKTRLDTLEHNQDTGYL